QGTIQIQIEGRCLGLQAREGGSGNAKADGHSQSLGGCPLCHPSTDETANRQMGDKTTGIHVCQWLFSSIIKAFEVSRVKIAVAACG
ncbi:MAG: hypothetical protein ACK55I_02505, partial [bacterium]